MNEDKKPEISLEEKERIMDEAADRLAHILLRQIQEDHDETP
jgi:hypothetical protein